jgi:hypothetical protein
VAGDDLLPPTPRSTGRMAERLRRPPPRRAPAQIFGAVVGTAYLGIGLLGFAVTGFDGLVANGDDALLGFDLNPFHNLLHLVIGGYLLGVSLPREPAIAQGALIGGGLVYVLAAFLGVTGDLRILSIDDALAPDNFLHLVSGALAVAVGLLGGPREGPAGASARPATARAPRT